MESQRLLRVVEFRSSAEDAVLDTALRDRLVPELGRLPGIELVHVARRASPDSGERVVVTVRQEAGRDTVVRDEAAALIGLGADVVDPAQVDARPALRVVSSVCFERPEAPTILRVYRGTVLPGRRDEYVVRADEGARADGATIAGLRTLHLAIEGSEGFVTVSTWTDWGSIEQATGGNVHRPMATRHAELIAEGEARHFEIVSVVDST